MSYQGQSPKVNRLRLNPRSSDPVNPSEGDLQYADGSVREEGVWVYKNSAWVKVGSDQAGDINYLSNGDAEAGSTTGWSLGNVTLTNKFPSGVPTFGSGAAGTLSFTNSSSSPIAGTRSFVLADSAATTAGNFLASDAFTIDAADLAKVLTIDLSYQVTSGTINASGTSSNSLGIAIYDVTASQWIMPAGVWAITQTSGVGRAVATFQTPITSTQYRLVLFNANATSGAVTLKLDRMSVGPQSIPVGAPVTDWQAYTPTFSASWGTTSAVGLYWRRVGSTVEIQGTFKAGTTTSAVGTISLPNGYVVSSNITSKSNVYTAVGNAPYNAIMSVIPYWITGGGETTIWFSLGNASNNPLVPIGVNAVIPSNGYVSVYATIPVQGLSSQVQMSSDTDTRVVAARASVAVSGAVTTLTPINFNTVESDTHGSITTGASWKYTAPVSGYYRVSTSYYFTTSASVFLYKNGTAHSTMGSAVLGSAFGQASTQLYLNAGDYIDLRPQGNVTTTGGGAPSTVPNTNYITIERLSGPSVVAATESVAASYWVSTATSAANTTSPFVFDSKEFDSHNAVTVGGASVWKFTAPVSGTYQVGGFASMAAGSTASIILYKNGIAYKAIGYGTATSPGSTFAPNALVKLSAGDYIDIRPSATASITGGSLASASVSNVSITRIGN